MTDGRPLYQYSMALPSAPQRPPPLLTSPLHVRQADRLASSLARLLSLCLVKPSSRRIATDGAIWLYCGRAQCCCAPLISRCLSLDDVCPLGLLCLSMIRTPCGAKGIKLCCSRPVLAADESNGCCSGSQLSQRAHAAEEVRPLDSKA
jgi:hypothetical protein